MGTLICWFLGHVWKPLYGMRWDGEPIGPVIGKRCSRCYLESQSSANLNSQEKP